MGLTTNWLQENKALQNCITKPNWELLNKKEKTFLLKKNTLRDSLQTLFDADQSVRQQYNYFTKNREKVRAVDAKNIKVLNKIITMYSGLPTAQLMGITNNNLFDTHYLIVIWHQTTENKQYDYSSLLLNEIQKGTIEPHTGAAFYKNWSGDCIKFGNIEIVKGIYQTSFPDSILMRNQGLKDSIEPQYGWRIPVIHNPAAWDTVNKERLNYGIESVSDYLKKQFYLHNNPEAGFLFFPPKGNTLYFANEQSYKIFINNTRPL